MRPIHTTAAAPMANPVSATRPALAAPLAFGAYAHDQFSPGWERIVKVPPWATSRSDMPCRPVVGEPDPTGRLADEFGDRAVVPDPTLVQHDDAFAQGRDVLGLVDGKDHDRRTRDLREYRAPARASRIASQPAWRSYSVRKAPRSHSATAASNISWPGPLSMT